MADWSTETYTTVLGMVKIDLTITATAYDTRLTQYVKSAKSAIEREGATLSSEAVEDLHLVAMYAGWLWRKRDTGEGMPRNLRWMLNNRIFSEKVGG